MKQKCYLVCQRHLRTTGKRTFTDWCPVGPNALFSSVDDARKLVSELLRQAKENGYNNVEYVVRLMFLN